MSTATRLINAGIPGESCSAIDLERHRGGAGAGVARGHSGLAVALALQWALPRLGMRWRGFRRVRGQVCKRLARRAHALGLPDLAAYRRWLEEHPEEWPVLDGLCRVTISRFWRDRAVYDALRDRVLPALASRPSLRALSAGCASVEEPYSLLLASRAAGVALEIVAIDASEALLDRARRGRYARGTLRELPSELLARAFVPAGDELELSAELRSRVRFIAADVRSDLPEGPFDLILCRNLAFTYFDEEAQRAFLARIHQRLVPGGALVIGSHESLPPSELFAAWPRERAIFQGR